MEYQITAITAQKKNPQRVNIFLDGEYAFGLTRLVAAWLQVGQRLSDEKIGLLKNEDEKEEAHNLALKYLNYRPRTEQEILQYLEKRQIPAQIAAQEIARLQKSGLVDDKQFIKAWVENRSEFRPRSRRALSYELRQRGIDPQALEGALDKVDDSSLAYQAASRQSPKFAKLEWEDYRKKLLSFLARRGFSYEDSREAVERAWKELHNLGLNE